MNTFLKPNASLENLKIISNAIFNSNIYFEFGPSLRNPNPPIERGRRYKGTKCHTFIRPTSQNAAQLLEALRDFGYDVSDITLEDLLTKKVLIRQYLVETDIHPFVSGVTFDQVWRNRVSGTYGNERVFYASLDDLITMKQAAGRPKDIEDLKVLQILKKKK